MSEEEDSSGSVGSKWAKGSWERGSDYKSQISAGNKELASWTEPKNGGGEQGAPAKNHWEGNGGAKENKVKDSASREPSSGGM